MTSFALVAIAKNEAKYIKEWIAFHLLVGVDYILIYNNESSDKTGEIISTCKSPNVQVVNWPSIDRVSPQRSAYADALKRLSDFDWVGFIDIDEFLLPTQHKNIHEFVDLAPNGASLIAINWKTFGDSGVANPDYELVTETFTRCGEEKWAHNRHFKSLVRPKAVSEMRIHHAVLNSGVMVDSELTPFAMEKEGHTPTLTYGGIQLNHYQVKTKTEFLARMRKGNANFPPGHPQWARDASEARFFDLNMNTQEDTAMLAYSEKIRAMKKLLWNE